MTIKSDIQLLQPKYVRISNKPRSIQAKAISYCCMFENNSQNYTVFSHALINSKDEKMAKLEDVINEDIELKVSRDFILDGFDFNKTFKKNQIYIICETNEGKLSVPTKDVKLIKYSDFPKNNSNVT